MPNLLFAECKSVGTGTDFPTGSATSPILTLVASFSLEEVNAKDGRICFECKTFLSLKAGAVRKF